MTVTSAKAKKPAQVLQSTLIQAIHLRWDKSARGGALSQKRNAVPLVFAVPNERLAFPSHAAHIEEQHWSHCNDFVSPFAQRHFDINLTKPYKFRCVTVQHIKDSLQLQWAWSWWDGGAPQRDGIKKLIVQSNQWAQIRWNGRFSCMDGGEWWYEQVTVNVAFFNGPPNGRIFTHSQPDLKWEQMAHLR